jgi:NAD(P)-dependent dehydrogenase (short-subunit alcohol dehydrogenase family)
VRRRALVTGARREGGIGRAIVRRPGEDGMEVVAGDKAPGCSWQVDIANGVA